MNSGSFNYLLWTETQTNIFLLYLNDNEFWFEILLI